MGITYNKQYTPKDRRVVTSGPADSQRKHVLASTGAGEAGLIAELKNQITFLQKQVEEEPTIHEDLYTPEQVDEEIIKAIKVETTDLKVKVGVLEGKNKELINGHKKEVASLNNTIKDKEALIKQLRETQSSSVDENKLTSLLNEVTRKIDDISVASQALPQTSADPGRPKMETVFVDPIEDEKKIEAYIEIEDISINEKEQMDDKVNKLKNIMGKLPARK